MEKTRTHPGRNFGAHKGSDTHATPARLGNDRIYQFCAPTLLTAVGKAVGGTKGKQPPLTMWSTFAPLANLLIDTYIVQLLRTPVVG